MNDAAESPSVGASVGAAARSVINRVMRWGRSIPGLAEEDGPPAHRPLPIKRAVVQATGIWLVTRIAFLLLTALAHAFGLAPAAPTAQGIFSANPQDASLLLPLLTSHPMLASWVHWDASWYLLISQYGYDVFTANTTNWFPLYPLQIHLLTLVFGREALLPAALLLSNLASLAAFIGLGLLAAQEEQSPEPSDDAPARLIKVTAAYPFAFFLFAPFTEAFFLACVVFCFLFARRGSWRWTAVCAFLAGLTRPTAVALAIPLAWEYGRQHGVWRSESWQHGVWLSMRWLRTLAGGLAAGAAAPLGLASYLVYVKLRYGDFLLPRKAQALYHGHQTWPVWQTLGVMFQRFLNPPGWSPAVALLYVDGTLLIVFLVITLLNVRRLPLFYTLYMLATLYLVLASPIPHRPELIPSAGRYLLMSVPIFLLFSRWIRGRPVLETVIVGGGFLLQALFVVIFFNGMLIE